MEPNLTDCLQMATSKTLRDIITRLDAARQHITTSINALQRLSSHDAVTTSCSKFRIIISEVDWDAQQDALLAISNLSRYYQQTSYAAFYARLPNLVRQVKQAKRLTSQAAESLGATGARLMALASEVDAIHGSQAKDMQKHKYWGDRDRGTAGWLHFFGHLFGPLSVGLGYLLWIPGNHFDCTADNHQQSLQVLQDVRGVLQDRILPMIHQTHSAMELAARSFDELHINLEHMQTAGDEALKAPASELNLHYEDMAKAMADLRTAVDQMLMELKRAAREFKYSG